MDEGQPQVGSGVRRCDVRWGRKWVHVREAHGHSRPWKKINRGAFEAMFPLCPGGTEDATK